MPNEQGRKREENRGKLPPRRLVSAALFPSYGGSAGFFYSAGKLLIGKFAFWVLGFARIDLETSVSEERWGKVVVGAGFLFGSGRGFVGFHGGNLGVGEDPGGPGWISGESAGWSGVGEMAEAREGKAGRPASPRVHSYARDLLRRFSGSFCPEDLGVGESAATEEDSAEIELSLGLSLGGCFGVDAVQRRGLVRSSSVASLPFLQREEQDPPSIPVLARTCSLPVEAEEEQRKRKELQSLRRLEAKRKRSEKRNGARWGCRDRAGAPAEEGRGDGMQLDGDVGAGKEEKAEGERFRAACPPAPNGAVAARAAARAAEGMKGFAPVTQGSAGSPGSSSSGVSDFDNRPPIRQGSGVAGALGNGAEPSPSVFQPLPNHTDSKAAVSPMSSSLARQPSYTQMEVEDSSVKPVAAAASAPRGGANGLRNMMEEMPCVSTTGSGPGGRKVEGFLYRYRKGEEVRIVCVCHGRFFTPAEFVKHAGGGDVAHPLRHIVVNPNPSSLL
ncbi:hypothetical protein Taro_005266 [Colocasia esculenta]|uniref:Ninja-family protein n=1 Tax=Colocasia esculenta TaxID=4460 RepID=A0A843TKD7_COLES|nr:hypothetical protein [Colocasia esculenta]